MDNNFLVAYIHEEKSYFYQIWNRNENYSSNLPPKSCQPEQYEPWHQKIALLETHLQNVPFLSEGFVCISAKGKGSKVELKEWKILDNTERTSYILTNRDVWSNQKFIQKFGMVSTHFEGMDEILTINNNKGGIYDTSIGFLCNPKVIGYSEEYIAIHLYHPIRDVLKIFRINDGKTVLNLHIEPSEKDQYLNIEGKYYLPFEKEGPNQIQV